MTADSPEKWDMARLERLIRDQVEESLHLDYKAADALQKTDKHRREIVKDVTAFANSDGGVIIYGIAEHRDRDKAHLPEKLDPVKRREISKEWLEHVIGNAAPRIDGVRIYPVPLSSNADHVAYVVEIPQSSTAHQALDHRYHRRHNFESVPMEDYEIRDILNRTTKPVIKVEARLNLKGAMAESYFLIRLTNTGKVMARHYLCLVELPEILNGQSYLPAREASDHVTYDLVAENTWAFCFTLGQGIGLDSAPLFPGDERVLRLEITPGRMHRPSGKAAEMIRIKAFSDSNPPIARDIRPSDIDVDWG